MLRPPRDAAHPELRTAAGAPIVAAGVVLAGTAGLIAVSPEVPVYEERYYMQSSYFLAEHRDLVGLMRTPLDLAAGPLYALLRPTLAPVTHLQVPAVRFISFGCLLVVLWACARRLRLLDYPDVGARAALLLTVPMGAPVRGMAPTETPALAPSGRLRP